MTTRYIKLFLVLLLLSESGLCFAQIAPQDGDSISFPDIAQVPLANQDSITASSQASSVEALEFDNESIEKLTEDLPETTTTDGMNLGVLEIEEQIALSDYDNKKDLKSRSILVQVYEKMAFTLCFPALKAIVNKHEFTPDSHCEDLLQKIEKLHANNNVLICARKGLESVECAQAFSQQMVKKASPQDLEAYKAIYSKFDPISEGAGKLRYQSFQKNLIQAHENFLSARTTSNLKILEAASYPVLSMLCRNQMLDLSKTELKKDTDKNSESLSGLADSIKNFEDSVFKGPDQTPSIAPENPQSDFYKARLLSAACNDTVIDLLNTDQRLPSPICFRDSFIAPSCISALRRFRTLKDEVLPGQPTATPKPKDSLASF